MTTPTAKTRTATKPAAKKAAPAAKPAAKTGKFNVADLPQTGTQQFRQGGDYKPAIRALSAFAKGNPVSMGHVKALIHLGWVKPGGVNAASKSTAFTLADNADLPGNAWSVGGPAADQISANLIALAEAGAPAEALDGLWAAYVGTI